MYSDIFSSKPPKYYVAPTRAVKAMHFILLAFSFIGLAFLVGETDNLDNTINGLSFFWISVLTGAILGIVFALVVDHLSPIYKLSTEFSKGLYLGSVMVFTTMLPPSASFINRHYGAAEIKPVHFKINSKGTDGKHAACFIFVTIENDEQRFSVPREYYNQVTDGKIATFYMKHGALGYNFVTKFE